MKITVYTVTDCQFSKAEKDYLLANNIQYEEKNLELNKEWLTEMLAVSNNFAGTPVTKIEKDDGQIIVLKGFTKEEFDQALGLQTTPQQQESTPLPQEITPQPQQTPTTQQPPSLQPDESKPENQPPQPQQAEDDQVGAILEKLQEKTDMSENNNAINQELTNQQVNQTTENTPATEVPPPPTNTPTIPDFQDK